MIAFRLEHTLHMQFDQTIQALLDGWGMGTTYAIEDNDIILPLENGRVKAYSFAYRQIKKYELNEEQKLEIKKIDELPDDDTRHVLKENSLQYKIIQYMLLLIRRVYGVKPYADRYMTKVRLEKLNKQLEEVGIYIALDENEYMTPTFYVQDEKVSLEEVIRAAKYTNFVIQVRQMEAAVKSEPVVKGTVIPAPIASAGSIESILPKGFAEPMVAERVEEPADTELTEAVVEETTEPVETTEMVETEYSLENVDSDEVARRMELLASEYGQGLEKAMELFYGIVGNATPGSEVYNSVCISMGELMYYKDDMESAIYFYNLCDASKLEDQDAFYERLGHCYLDNRMKDYAEDLKRIFRADHNEAYRESHAEELANGLQLTEVEKEEYKTTCIKVGKGKYREGMKE